MKKINIAIVLICLAGNLFAQQLHQSSFYDLQALMHNPAMAGMQQKNVIAAAYRSQWSGISGSPTTQTIFGSFNLPSFDAGVGGYIFNDVTGPTARRGINLDFAKHIKVSDKGKFSLGIEAKIQQYSLNKSKVSTDFLTDPVLGNSANKVKFDAGFGIGYADDKLSIGASVSQLVQSKLDFYSGSLTRSTEARLYRHYYVHGAYTFTDGTTKITPNAIVTYLPNAPFELQGGVTVEHNKVFWWGVGARLKQSYMLNAGVIIKENLKIGYAFDAYQTPLSTFESGFNSHEIGLRYQF